MSRRSPEHNKKIGESIRKNGRGATETKYCPSCEQTLNRAEDFRVRKGGHSESYCKACERRKQKERWNSRTEAQKVADARKNREFILMRNYGVTLEWYEAKLAEQDGKCAICFSEVSSNGRALPVDHDHHSGEPRGILCDLCNRGLGMLRDDPALLRRAAGYIEEYLDPQTGV